MKLALHFGALAPNIAQQLFNIGVVIKGDVVKHIQKDADAIVRLNIRGILNDSSTHACRMKLMKKIVSIAARHKRK